MGLLEVFGMGWCSVSWCDIGVISVGKVLVLQILFSFFDESKVFVKHLNSFT